MSARELTIVVGVAFLLSGCAGGRTRQDLSRVQSQIGLLEERIAQLERGGDGAVAVMPIEPAVPVAGEPMNDERKPSGTKNARASTKTSSKASTREIQEALKNAGFYQGSVDGKIGSMTREAVKEFQRVHGLNDDGVVGKQTWAKLSAYLDLSNASGQASAADTLK